MSNSFDTKNSVTRTTLQGQKGQDPLGQLRTILEQAPRVHGVVVKLATRILLLTIQSVTAKHLFTLTTMLEPAVPAIALSVIVADHRIVRLAGLGLQRFPHSTTTTLSSLSSLSSLFSLLTGSHRRRRRRRRCRHRHRCRHRRMLVVVGRRRRRRMLVVVHRHRRR